MDKRSYKDQVGILLEDIDYLQTQFENQEFMTVLATTTDALQVLVLEYNTSAVGHFEYNGPGQDFTVYSGVTRDHLREFLEHLRKMANVVFKDPIFLSGPSSVGAGTFGAVFESLFPRTTVNGIPIYGFGIDDAYLENYTSAVEEERMLTFLEYYMQTNWHQTGTPSLKIFKARS